MRGRSQQWRWEGHHVLQEAAVVELVGRRQAAAAEHHQLPAVAVVTWRASRWSAPLAVQQGAAHLRDT